VPVFPCCISPRCAQLHYLQSLLSLILLLLFVSITRSARNQLFHRESWYHSDDSGETRRG